jgi:glycosyltransferase involved in cell wall biosynthesis
MKIALISRATLLTAKGGDSVQITETKAHLEKLGVDAEIILNGSVINYEQYDLLHFFNLIRPADILRHIKKSGKPFLITPIWIDYSAYDQTQRKGVFSLAKYLSRDKIEYLKTIVRWARGKDKWPGITYLFKGQYNSMAEIVKKARVLLTNSDEEYETLCSIFLTVAPKVVVPLGINDDIFYPTTEVARDQNMIICVARIEGIKNQLHLIKALNNTSFTLYLIGAAAPNQQAYYQECKRIAGSNIKFVDHLPQQELISFYQQAGVHVLPSWYESCGLSSLEAAAMGCSVVITRNGFASSYFREEAFYCDPASPKSILENIKKAATQNNQEAMQKKIQEHYTWKLAAQKINTVYKKVLAAQ